MQTAHKRMPVILDEADVDEYLEASTPPAHLLRTWPGQLSVVRCVSPLGKTWQPGPPVAVKDQS